MNELSEEKRKSLKAVQDMYLKIDTKNVDDYEYLDKSVSEITDPDTTDLEVKRLMDEFEERFYSKNTRNVA
ncbi:MAG: hypothetical protein CME70_03350 [Halobacteriovorax sp.]|nr:hypothetical protein [Halobacteriovorax sp.]MBK23020.1 hypothetical protein [Halobacteriovorax sp.]|tara:strand:- start:2805 stop:3017 length:213 start_codon:yes stop_codon:yes gene_type:complete